MKIKGKSREFGILMARFICTLSELASIYGVSRERVKQIETKSKAKIRRLIQFDVFTKKTLSVRARNILKNLIHNPDFRLFLYSSRNCGKKTGREIILFFSSL